MKSAIITLLLLAVSFSHSKALTIYVTASGAGDFSGSDWANAAAGNSLRTIIQNALPGDAIWVACGIYTPTANTDRSLSFSMRNGIGIYGGFAGTESTLADRDLNCGPCSVLSGEIGSSGAADNSYKVVYNENIDSTAVLDGFVIRDANDDRTPTSFGNGLGGGVYNHGFNPGGNCSPTIRNCVLTANAASWGGGAFNNGYNQGNAEPTYVNCIFEANHAYIEAGGMDSYGVGGNASPILYNCIFYGNTSATNVGAMYAWGGNSGGNCHPRLYNCIFANNSATNGYGGAFIADNLDENGTTSSGSCTVTLVNCIVWNNTATGLGPQFFVKGTGAAVVAHNSDIDLTGQSGAHVLDPASSANLNTDPLFNDIADLNGADNCLFTGDDGLRLVGNSMCIDAGMSAGTYATDIAGLTRLIGAGVDMGAYEYSTPLGLLLQDQQLSLELYPNPVSETATLYANGREIGEIQVWNALGQEIGFSGTRISSKAYIMDLSELKPGLYHLRAAGSLKSFMKR